MGGRAEKEAQAKEKMLIKLSQLPEIFTLFYDWMDAREQSYTTMNNYINHVIEFMNFYTRGKANEKFYETVSDNDIEKYMSSLRRKIVDGEEVGNGDEIRAAKWSSLNKFFKFLSQKKHIDNNPMLLTERPKIKTTHDVVYMTPEEIESVMMRVREESKPRTRNRDLCIMAMGLGTALRVSAIVNINVEDIDFKTNTIRVIEKGRKTKDVKFSENLRNLLLIWLKDRELFYDGNTESGPLFLSQLKTRLSVDRVEKMVKKYTDHLPKKITPHKLRSSAAMNLYGSGVDLLTIASILGHESVTTTQRYTKAYDEEKQKATDILDKLF